MDAQEFKRWLKKQGCRFETQKGGSGHINVILGNRRSQIPMHGKGQELGKGLIKKVKRDLGLEDT